MLNETNSFDYFPILEAKLDPDLSVFQMAIVVKM